MTTFAGRRGVIEARGTNAGDARAVLGFWLRLVREQNRGASRRESRMVASHGIESKERLGRRRFLRRRCTLQKFLGQRDDDARRA
jgi:hypothetical protein